MATTTMRVVGSLAAGAVAIGVRRLIIRASNQLGKSAWPTWEELRVDYQFDVRGRSVRIRNVELRDAVSLFELLERNRTRLERWFSHWVPKMKSPRDEEVFIQKTMHDRKHGKGIVAVVEVDGEIAGTCSLLLENGRGTGHIGYWIGRAWEGQGIVSATVRRIKSYAFLSLQLRRVAITIDSTNARSGRVARRCGLQEAGTKYLSPMWREVPGHESFVQLNDRCRC